MTEIRLTSDNGVNKIENRSVELFPFQKTGVAFLLANQRGLLADDMGTGKTVQTLAAIAALEGRNVNVLIVSPASLTLMWDSGIRKQIPDSEIIHIKAEKNPVELKRRLRFIICSYNYIQKESNVERLSKLKWHVVIADEAHALKNWTSKTCKGFRKLTKKHTGKVWMLTGTPATNSGADYYPYLEIIQPGKWGTLSEFREMFCEKEQDYWSGYFKYKGVRADKKPLLRKAFSKIMLRRRKEEVIKDLPSVLSTHIPVDIDESLKKASGLIREEFIEDLKRNKLAMSEHVMKLMREIGEAKVPAAVDYILGVEEPLVVFCCNTSVLREIEETIKKAGKTVDTVMGEDSRLEKNRAVEDFQSGLLDVILLNLHAGGVGITLHRSSHMLMVQQYWSPAVMEQAMARIIRIGQVAKCVNIAHLFAPGTIDEQIMESLEEKSNFMKQVMGDRIWKR